MNESRRRIVLPGIAASPGVAVGRAVVYDGHKVHVPRRRIDEDEIDEEVERLQRAIARSRAEVEGLRDRLGDQTPAEYRLILEAHVAIHDDHTLIAQAEAAIHEHRNAEWAVERALQNITGQLQRGDQGYFRDLAVDLDHVGKRIIAQLVGHASQVPASASGAIVIAEDLYPADAAQLVKLRVQALVTGLGTATSHTAILARTLEIPAVVGVAGVTGQIGSGDTVIVDALRSEVIIQPDAGEEQRAHKRRARYMKFTDKLRSRTGARSETRDGVRVHLLANVDLAAEAALAADQRCDGIGLCRTEMLYMNRQAPPDEDEQHRVYTDILDVMGQRPVVFRTFDVGGDVLTTPRRSVPPNPALGLRATRLALKHRDAFGTQLRAMLRAAAHGAVDVMFPLVSGVGELREAKACLDEARLSLEQARAAYGNPRVGIMVELPSAVAMADRLAEEADFFAVGTNDLVQYALGVDRANPQVAYLADSLDPALLRLVQQVLTAAESRQIPVSMCGSMAADPLAIPVVLGLGYRRLSVPVGSLALVREIVSRIELHEARELARDALALVTAEDVRALIIERFRHVLEEIWLEAGTPAISTLGREG